MRSWRLFLGAVSLLAAQSWAFAGSSNADSAGLVVKPSARGVSEIVDRLERILGEKGITVFARVDHAQGAEKVDLELAPTELLIFGNPKLGTPLMQSAREVGIDLPMKVLVWEDQDGEVWLAYNAPEHLADRHGIEDRDEVLETMAGALSQLTDAAIQADR